MKRIVMKLGGSHLTNPDWPQRLLALVEKFGPHEFFLIVGGGEAIEAMRQLDRIHHLDEQSMHWRCVWMLKATTDIAEELLVRAKPAIDFKRIGSTLAFQELMEHSAQRPTLCLIDALAFYNNDERFELLEVDPPVAGWVTTTDSIAIYCAALLHADECVLLKSCDIDDAWSIEQAVALGIVDEECLAMVKQFANVRLLKL